MAVLHLPLIENDMPFPSIETALSEPDGLLAFGGDLSVQRLIAAYRSGIFPWFSEGEPILWWSPSNRAIIIPNTLHTCLLYTSPSPRDQRGSRMPSSA